MIAMPDSNITFSLANKISREKIPTSDKTGNAIA